MTDVFVCTECSYPPHRGCMYWNSSTAFPYAKMKGLKCPKGMSFCNWKYLDYEYYRKHGTPNTPSKNATKDCYSQKDLDKTLEEFYEEQGRVYKKGRFIFVDTKQSEP